MGRPKGSTNTKRTQTAQQDMQQQAMENIGKTVQEHYHPTSGITLASENQINEAKRLYAALDREYTDKDDRIYHSLSYEIMKSHITKLAKELAEKNLANMPQPQTLPQTGRAQGAVAIRLAELRAIRDVTDLEMPDEEEDRFNEEIWKTGTIAGLPVRFNSFVGNYTTSNEKTYSRFSFYYLDDESDMEEHFFHLFNQNLASKIVACFDANDDEPFATTLKKIPLANGHTMWQMQRATF